MKIGRAHSAATAKASIFMTQERTNGINRGLEAGGGALRYAGNFNDGAMRFEGETIANGKKTLQKLTFFKIDENTVRQFSEASTDDGKTWTVTTDLKYVKRK